MIDRFSHEKLTWVCLKNPSTEEVQTIMGEYDVPPGLLGDLSTPVPHSETVRLDRAIKITLDFPIVKRTDMQGPHEVKFIILKNTLITVQYEDMEAIDRFKKQFEVMMALRKDHTTLNGAHLFVALMNDLYSVMGSKLDYLESKLTEIEDQIALDKEKEIIFEISKVSKRMITFRHILHSHEKILTDARPLLVQLYHGEVDSGMQGILDTYALLVRRLASLFETLGDLRETNFALLTTKQNEVMKILTIMAFITFPLSLFTSTFGMNTNSTPIVGMPGDFWIIVGIMFSAMVCFFAYFKYKRWI